MTWLNERAPTTVWTVGQEVVIEKYIPIPPKEYRKKHLDGTGAVTSYPWAEMEKGDSFVALPHHSETALRSAAWTVGCRLNRDFSTRMLSDGTVRIWRTK